MTDKTPAKNLSDAFANMMQLEKEYLEAVKASVAARSYETSMRNDLNNAQKVFDALVAELKAKAPRDTDWSRTCDSRLVITGVND